MFNIYYVYIRIIKEAVCGKSLFSHSGRSIGTTQKNIGIDESNLQKTESGGTKDYRKDKLYKGARVHTYQFLIS